LRRRGDSRIDQQLEANSPKLYAEVVGEPKVSVFGTYKALDEKKVDALPAEQKAEIKEIEAAAKKNALMTVAILPVIMFICYLALILYFKSQGGYKPKIIISEKEEELLMTGGSVGPADM
jgi:hypothetical protein